MGVKTFKRPKDPDEIVDYGVEWDTELQPGDVLASSSWIGLPSGTLAVGPGGSSFTDDTTRVYLQGGDLDMDYEFLNRVTTTPGARTYDQSVKLRVRKR